MTDALGPPGGWASEPRAPLRTVLSEETARQVVGRAWRVGRGRPALVRLGLCAVLGILVAWPRGGATGATVAVVLALALVVLPLALGAARSRGVVSPGDVRTTGYDRRGHFVFEGSTLRTYPAGWARSVERRGDLAIVLPRARAVQGLVMPGELLTGADAAFLTRDVATEAADPVWPEVAATREVVVTPALRREVRRGVLRNLLSRPVLVLGVVLVGLELVVAGGLPWPAPLVLAVAVTAVSAAIAVVLLVALVRWSLPNARVLRSGVVGDRLHLRGSRMLPTEVPLESLRTGTATDAAVRVRHGIGWAVVPLELVPAEARPRAAT